MELQTEQCAQMEVKRALESRKFQNLIEMHRELQGREYERAEIHRQVDRD